MNSHIPAILLAGYLGAGKTTLINHLLSGDHGKRIAVLVNDFGAVNIDASLIAETGDQTISLTNGCVCCSIADDLGAALDAQTARTDPPDQIVVEASGVAEPGRLATYLAGWPGVALDCVVTVADAETVRQRSDDKFVGGLVRRQLSAADVLVLNKIDLLAEESLASVTGWLQGLSRDAVFVRSRDGVVDPALMLGVQRASRTAVPAKAHDHDAVMVARTLRPAGPVSRAALEAWLAGLPETIHRLKGFAGLDDGGSVLVQKVGHRHLITDSAPGPDGESVLILIGANERDLDAAQATFG